MPLTHSVSQSLLADTRGGRTPLRLTRPSHATPRCHAGDTAAAAAGQGAAAHALRAGAWRGRSNDDK